MFVIAIHFHPSLIFTYGLHSIDLQPNIGLGWKWKAEANTLAYYDMATFTAVKRFYSTGLRICCSVNEKSVLNSDLFLFAALTVWQLRAQFDSCTPGLTAALTVWQLLHTFYLFSVFPPYYKEFTVVSYDLLIGYCGAVALSIMTLSITTLDMKTLWITTQRIWQYSVCKYTA